MELTSCQKDPAGCELSGWPTKRIPPYGILSELVSLFPHKAPSSSFCLLTHCFLSECISSHASCLCWNTLLNKCISAALRALLFWKQNMLTCKGWYNKHSDEVRANPHILCSASQRFSTNTFKTRGRGHLSLWSQQSAHTHRNTHRNNTTNIMQWIAVRALKGNSYITVIRAASLKSLLKDRCFYFYMHTSNSLQDWSGGF